MKILHITNNYPTDKHPIFGIFVKEQIDSLRSTGLECDVFFINGRENGKSAYFKGLFKLLKKLKNTDYDILHCHHIYSAVLLLLTLNFFKFKRIISYQNPPSKEGGLFLYQIIKLFFDGVILKDTKSIDKKVYYLPNGTNTEFFINYSRRECIAKLNLDASKKYILFMDSNKEKRTQKRVDRYDKVIDYLLKNGNPYNVAPIKLTNTKRNLIPYYMNACSLHLITSDYEGSPNSVKECLACNTSVVSTPVGNIHDLIGDVNGCYVSKSFDPSELAELVVKSLTHKNFTSRNQLFEKKLDIESVSKKLLNIYNSI